MRNSKSNSELPFFIRNGCFFLIGGMLLFLYMSKYVQVPYEFDAEIYLIKGENHKLGFKIPEGSIPKDATDIIFFIDNNSYRVIKTEQSKDMVIAIFDKEISKDIAMLLMQYNKYPVTYQCSFWNYLLNFLKL